MGPTSELSPVPEGLPFGKSLTLPPTALSAAAYHGLAGAIVRRIEPHTEADPAALLLTLLTMFGNLVGRSAHFLISGGRHYPVIFTALVGPTASGRKGTALHSVLPVFRAVDADWAERCIVSGLSSGEGIIESVRNATNDDRTRLDAAALAALEDRRRLVVRRVRWRPEGNGSSG